MSNTITAFFKGRVGVAESVYQHDYGLVLVLDGVNFESVFDAYFETTEQDEAIPVIGRNNRVAIPNDCLSRAGTVVLHIPVHTGVNDSEVEYIVSFKVIGRAIPIYDGTPRESTAIAKAIAVLQDIQGDVNTWLDNHPEATTTVQDGSISRKKLNDNIQGLLSSFRLNGFSSSFEASAAFSDLEIPSGYSFQCGTFDTKRSLYYFVFTNDETVKIVTMSQSFEFVAVHDISGAYHGNDITYNSNDDMLLLATMTDAILIINPNDFTIESYNFGERVSFISYDENEDVYYIGNTDSTCVFYKCDSQLNKIETFSSFSEESVRQLLALAANQHLVMQATCMINDDLYIVAYTWSTASQINDAGYIILITGDQNYAVKLTTSFAGEEPESIVINGSECYMLSWRHLYVEDELIVSRLSGADGLVFASDSYFRGEPLANVDLNNVIGPGNYFSKNTASTSTIQNAPVQTSFSMMVRSQGYENIRQIVFADDATGLYTRTIYPSTGYIENWYKVEMRNTISDWQSFRLTGDNECVFYFRKISTTQVEWKLDTGSTKHPTQIDVGTLPSGFVPSTGWHFSLARWINNGTQGVNALRITVDGKVQIITTDDYVHGSGVYSID